MSNNRNDVCSRCGRVFRPGQTRYLVSIRVVADFDGVIDLAEGGSMDEVLRQVEDKSEAELMDEVARQFSLILCKPCRDRWVMSPLGEDHDHGPAAGQMH